MVVPVPLWVTAPESSLPAMVALPEPEFTKAPLPRARLLEATNAPALVLVNEEAVSVPPPKETVPLVLVRVTAPAVMPVFVIVTAVAVPKVALSLELNTEVALPPLLVAHEVELVFQFPLAPPAQ